MATNLYETLGITKDATPEEVRKAYRRRALETHPDRLPQDCNLTDKEAAEEQFRLVNNAYEVLTNAENRKLYDQYGVWPPPSEQPRTGRDAFVPSMDDPLAHDPFFWSPFGHPPRHFAFTDPFELFNSIFGDLHDTFHNDPFFANTPLFRSPSVDPFFRSPFGTSLFGGFMREPFGASMLGSSPFSGMLTGPALSTTPSMPGFQVYSSSTRMMGTNRRWVSCSHTTRTVNGRTEVITKEIDAQGNEHVTHYSPEGERYTINGVEQPSRGSMEDSRRSSSGSSSHRQPAAIADKPANPPAPVRAFSVPVAGSSRSHAHPPVQAVPPVIPPPPRRSSRRSHDHASVEDRRGYNAVPTYGLVTPEGGVGDQRYSSGHARAPAPMPDQYSMHHESRDGHSDRALERERRDSRLHREHRAFQHSYGHDRREPVNTPVGIAMSTSGGSGRRGAGARKTEQQKQHAGWRGW